MGGVRLVHGFTTLLISTLLRNLPVFVCGYLKLRGMAPTSMYVQNTTALLVHVPAGLSGCRGCRAVGVLSGAKKVAEDIMHCQSNGYMVKILGANHGPKNKTHQHCNA